MLNKKILGIELHDDATPYGGLSFAGETVDDFQAECGTQFADLAELNQALVECGIKPVAAN